MPVPCFGGTHWAPPKSLVPILLSRHVEGGSANFGSSGSLQLENECQFPFTADAPVTMNDSPRAPSIRFKRGNTLFPAPRVGVRTCTAIPTRPLLSTSPLLPSSQAMEGLVGWCLVKVGLSYCLSVTLRGGHVWSQCIVVS